MTITIEPKEVEHVLMFASLTVTCMTIAFMLYIVNRNDK